MATAAESTAVKSLNTGPGRKRFTFKNLAQRMEDIDIDVYKNYDTRKSEPSEGSTYVKDCLVEWRELNTAEDFISFYEEMMPWVQTLPQVLQMKDGILTKLLNRLQLQARLSLQPILRLIAALSRDLQKDFLPILPRVADSLFLLLESGADREPEVVQEIFISWSNVMVNLQKYLIEDVNHRLKITRRLRYYPKDYVQEHMAESVSYLLRNSAGAQAKKGIQKIMMEVVKKPSDVIKSAVSALLWHVMRGTSSSFHSRTENEILPFLLDSSVIGIGDEQGSDTVVEIVTAALGRACEELQPQELKKMWNCLIRKISGCVYNESLLLLSHLLPILISTVGFSSGGKISDYQPMLDLVELLIEKVIMPLHGSDSAENCSFEVFDGVLQLMLSLLDGFNGSDESVIRRIAGKWAPVFQLRNKSLVKFIEELLKKKHGIRHVFGGYMLSVLNEMVVLPSEQKEILLLSLGQEEVIYLLLTYFEKVGVVKEPEEVSRLCNFLRLYICDWISMINDISHGDSSRMRLDESKLALIWGAVTCYHPVFGSAGNPFLVMGLIDALDRLLTINADHIAGISKSNWQSLLNILITQMATCVADLVECFHSFVAPNSDVTPCATILSLLLQSLQKVHAIAESRSRQLVPLFLKFLGYDDGDVVSVGSFKSHACKGKAWRGVLKEWLNLLKLMSNSKSLYRSQQLKEVLISRLLDENDAEIQMSVLECLANWKCDSLLPYFEHLKNLITSKNLCEELATWSLSKESHHIQDQHREYMIPIAVRLLVPKVRKLKTLGSRKHASVHHRRAVLGFLGQLDVGELPLFFALLIKPLLPVPSEWFWRSSGSSIEEFQALNVVKGLTIVETEEISWKKRYGFLHVIEDIFKSFDEFHLKPFLNLLMSFVARIMEVCTYRLDGAKNSEASQIENLASDDVLIHEASGEDSVTEFYQKRWEVELRIFKLLSAYIVEPLGAKKFVEILLPFLGNNPKHSDECLEVLKVIKGILPKLGGETTDKILKAVAPLLLSAGVDIRLSICDILNGLALQDPSVVFLAKFVHDLNAMSISEMDELDYDTRINAYESVNSGFFYRLRKDHALVILSHTVHDLSSEELIIRQSASRLLLSFIQFSSKVLGSDPMDCEEMIEPMAASETWTKACVERIIKNFILKHMGEAMSREISIQREWIALLREMVLQLAELPSLKSIGNLASVDDAEKDFFNNILHLQKHRRAKALSRFRKVIVAGNFSEDITKKIFVPLFFKMMFDVQPGKGEHIRDACVDSLAAISGHMQWESYLSFLLGCFREMALKPDKHKVLLRLICSVLDHFHFSGILSQDPKDNLPEISPGIIGLNVDATPRSCTTTGVPKEIQVCLQKKVLPKIQKLLIDSEGVDVTINVAALKLLKLLPLDTMESQLPSIIHRISNFLKNRLESIRDEARLGLAACSKELGIEYLQFLVKIMRGTLKRGYEMHMLGYTLNFILCKALANSVVGKLDYCLEELLSVVENDILGDVAEEKDVEKIASKMKETRKRKSFETLELIARNVSFKESNAMKLLSPVKTHLQKHLTPRKKAKLETMLKHIATGIECNTSVSQKDLFTFVYGLIKDGMTEETPKGKDLLPTKPSKISSKASSNKKDASSHLISYGSQSSHVITGFALGLLHNRLKKMKLGIKDVQLLSMLDPFVELLGNCLGSKYEAILSSALRCLTLLVRLPLPTLESQADKIKSLLLDTAQKSGTSNSPRMESCLSLLTVLLRSTRITLSDDQLHMLIQFPLFIDLEKNPSFTALSLLKAIVSRTLVVHEIYDIATRVSKLMVTSQSDPIRKKCSQILMQFLLNYRLSNKRLQQQTNFLLKNLSYEHASGREAVLEMLHVIITKFPKSILDAESYAFFVKLVACLANDTDSKVRSMIGTVLKHLIECTSQQSLVPILEFSVSWYVSDNQMLWSVAAQTLGLLVEVLKKRFQSHVKIVLPVHKKIMKYALDGITKQPDTTNEESRTLYWKQTYYSMIMLEKILREFPELYWEKDFEDIWEAICELLLYPHMWIRNVSNRLIASYFASASEREKSQKLEVGSFLIMKPSKLFAVAVSLCCQLKAPLIDDKEAKVLTQILVFAISGVHKLAGQSESLHLQEFWSTLELNEQSHFLKAFHLLGSRKGRMLLGLLTSDVVDSVDQVDDATSSVERADNAADAVEQADASMNSVEQVNGNRLQSMLVSPLLKKIGKVALQMDDMQTKIVFNSFSMISIEIGKEGCQQHAYDMLLPLYKVSEGFAGRVIMDDLKQMAADVLKKIKDIIGDDSFVRVCNEIRKNLKAKRDKRKNIEKVMAVVNPMRNAKRKLRIAAKHRANKKRKIITMKMGRSGY
ncbi:hypothetical protein MKX01_039325 [Papaver californicum]|nr:hypothetical protein MKX01_039325 [Papaver californicum]